MGKKIVALGELLIDFTPAGKSETGRPVYEQNPGGAPANVLVSAVRQGGEGLLISCVGDDMFGCALRDVVSQNDIDVTGVQFTSEAATTLAFVSLNDKGDRSFAFCRKPGADMLLDKGKLPINNIANAAVFHFGSLSLSHERSREATLYAAEAAQRGGALISYDPNWRPSLWQDKESGITAMKLGLGYAQIVKLSGEELELLSGIGDLSDGTAALTRDYPKLKAVIVTLGPDGCFYRMGDKTGLLPTYDVHVVDTTGSGDAFWGAFLHSLTENQSMLNGDTVSLEAAIKRGNAAGSLCAAKRGAIDAIPGFAEVDNMIENGKLLVIDK